MDVVVEARAELVCGLDEPQAAEPTVTGSKAASLARSRRHGLPVVPGFALTTTAHRRWRDNGRRVPVDLETALVDAWSELSHDGTVPVVVRSSSTVEDVGSSSMAGRFRSVLDVRDRERLLAAVADVLRSGDDVGGPDEPGPMGVLVQRHVDPDRGGVMFGVDPVTGDTAHLVVEAVAGGPDKLVSGRVTAQHYVLTRAGRLVTLDHQPARTLTPWHHRGRLLGVTDLLELARLARRTEKVFGGPQDVEWAIETDGTLLLLQSRPVTAAAAAGTGPVLGPGPLGETFPDPLSRLEVDLWVRPLRAGVLAALTEARAVPPRRVERSPVVTTVDGRVAADLELLGYVPAQGSPLGVLDPRPAFHRLAAAWRTGLVRADLPHRAEELAAEVDTVLAKADVVGFSETGLVDLLDRGTELLERLHRAEVLAGALLPPSGSTAASMALSVLRSLGPEADRPDVVREHPVLLALVPPSLAGPAPLPRPPTTAPPVQHLGPREALRLRVRWVQELTARVVHELDRRLTRRDVVEPGTLPLLSVAEVRALVAEGRLPQDLHDRRAADIAAALAPPLPAQFRLSEDGSPLPVARRGARPEGGIPAGGGRGVGRVVHGSTRRPPSPGEVLVVRELQPGLAAHLPGLAGLVAETGSTLSHLAILAREYDVPTVVAVHDALRRFSPGTRVFVDGTTGEVRAFEGGDAP